MTQDEMKRLHERASAMSDEEKRIFIQHMGDDELYEELGRQMEAYKELAYRFRQVAKDFRLEGA